MAKKDEKLSPLKEGLVWGGVGGVGHGVGEAIEANDLRKRIRSAKVAADQFRTQIIPADSHVERVMQAMYSEPEKAAKYSKVGENVLSLGGKAKNEGGTLAKVLAKYPEIVPALKRTGIAAGGIGVGMAGLAALINKIRERNEE